jgi:hypothetical protein
MDGSIYLLTRKVEGDEGEPFNESVAVYASSEEEAHQLVALEFARLRKASSNPEHAYRDTPPFSVNNIKLDDHKLVAYWVTQ